MSFSSKNCKNIVKMQSSCDSSIESDRQEQGESNSMYPVVSHSSVYYEENQLFSELDEVNLSPVESIPYKTPSSHFVEIREEFSTPIDLPPISWYGYNSVPKLISATNTGRIILISGQWTHNKPYISGGPLNGSYIFSQIHFHSPSEHEIDGKRYPLEMHVVHYKTCYLTQERAMEEKDGTVVLVYLFQIKNNATDSSLSFVSKLDPKITKINGQAEISNITLDQIVQPFISNYYIYWGSVSTVKNSYILQWVINCNSLYVTQQEMDDLLSIMSSNEYITEKHAPQMKPVNNAIFRVENYILPDGIKEKVTTCGLCHDHLVQAYQNASSKFGVHGGGFPLQNHSNVTDSKELQGKKDVQLQTSSRDRTVSVALEPIICESQEKNKENIESTGTPLVFTCSSCKTISQISICEDGKKKKKKKKGICKKVLSCPSVSASLSDRSSKNSEEHVEECKPKKLTSHSSAKVSSSLTVCYKKEKDEAEKEQPVSDCQDTKTEKQKKEIENCEAVCENSKISVCSCKQVEKEHKVDSEICETPCVSKKSSSREKKNFLKRIIKKDSEVCETSCDSEKSSSHECHQSKKTDSEPCECVSECSTLCLHECKPKKKKEKKQKSDTDCRKCESGSSKSSREKKKEKKEKEKKEKKEKKLKKKRSKTDSCETTSASSCVLVCCEKKVTGCNEAKKPEDECTWATETSKAPELENCQNADNCAQIDIQCMPVLGSAQITTETLTQFENMVPNESSKLEKAEAVKSNESMVSGRSAKYFTEEIILENVPKSSDCNDDIKTIFEKKEKKKDHSTSEYSTKDFAVDFLLSPNVQKCPSGVLAKSDSKAPEEKKIVKDIIPNRFNVKDVTINRAMVSGVILPADKPKDSSKEFCLQTEHLFRTERKGDFSGCVSQEYNVAIIYNQNILQEFKGTFHPNKLELGSYEKLDLVPKYLDPDNITVRLEDCIVKMETLDQLYIRAKFLLKKIDVEDMIVNDKNEFYEGSKMPEFVTLDAINKECDSSVNTTRVEGQQLDDKNENQKKLEYQLPTLKESLENQESKDKSQKVPDMFLEQTNKNILYDSPKQSIEVKKEKEKSGNDSDEKSENDSDEKNDKGLKNLYNKRKKTVYFTYEKIEKDVNSGKKIFVGSFRTKDDMKVLSKEKKLPQNIENFFSFEKFIESNEDKKFFLMPNKESDSEEIIRVENSLLRDDSKIKTPTKSKQADKPNSNKDLITLHKYKPKNTDESSRSERKNLALQETDHTIKLDILLSKKSVQLKISEIDSSINKAQKYSPKMDCQTAVIVIPVELHSLSKIELVVIEHPKNSKENVGKRKKEYIPCLNGYF